MEVEIDSGRSHLYLFRGTNISELCPLDLELNHYPPIFIYNQIKHQRRDVGFYSNESIGYRYSGQLMESRKLTLELEVLLERVNDEFEENYNGILINYYADGNDYISAHSDDETCLGNSGVISISIGATRTFRIRDKKDKSIVKDVKVEHGDIVWMEGDFQKEFTHEIPVEKRVREGRWSFTFRHHKE